MYEGTLYRLSRQCKVCDKNIETATILLEFDAKEFQWHLDRLEILVSEHKCNTVPQ